jgi:hypothetical protein
MMQNSNKRKIKRKAAATTTNYFSQETDEAIEKWQNSSCLLEKEKLYNEFIGPAFDCLVTNLLWVYTFKIPRESIVDIKQDCISFLYENLNKWDPSRGTKAFSYFNISGKRWLINRSRKLIKENDRQIGLTDEELQPWDLNDIEASQLVDDPSEIFSHEEDMQMIIKDILSKLGTSSKNPKEILLTDAIKSIFDNMDKIDIINRRSILVYLREITGLSNSELTSSLYAIRKKYKNLTKETGIFSYEISD